MSTRLQTSGATLSFLAELRQELSARIPPSEELSVWLETAYGEAVFGATILAEDPAVRSDRFHHRRASERTVG
jgi:hypothetical protein